MPEKDDDEKGEMTTNGQQK